MRKLTLSLLIGATTLATAGVASAQQAPAPKTHEMTRASVQQRADRMFDRLDANHDGKIDEADRAVREKARFDRMDTDHDGKLSYAEFTASHGHRDGQHTAHAGQQPGALSAHGGEHRMAISGFRGRGGFPMMRLAQAEKAGGLTKAAFEAAMLERFDRLDANHDGIVTPDEAKAARDKMRQQWQSRHEARQS
jgi:Ca2+-binding EF-hand superfamily protein